MGRHFLIAFLLLLLLTPLKAFNQLYLPADSISLLDSPVIKAKPVLHYSIGSTFTYIPGHGSVTGLTISPFYSFPLNPKVSVEAGIIAGRYFSNLNNTFQELRYGSSFNSLSVFGSATYHLNKRLSLYGTGIKQLAGSMPMYNLSGNRFSVGSTLDFGNFRIGAEISVSDRYNYYSPFPFGGQSDYPLYPR